MGGSHEREETGLEWEEVVLLKAASVASGVDRFIPKQCLRDELPGPVAQLFG